MRTSRFLLLALPLCVLGSMGMDCIPPEILEQINRANCPNPAVAEFNVTVLEKTSDTSARIRLTAVVRNNGLQTFDSGEGQQAIRITEGAVERASEEFGDLEPLEEATLSFETDWSTTSEFNADFEASITYDPDIFIDGNEQNDDCRTGDNERTLTVEEINSAVEAA